MKIAIIGATGYVGSRILNEALERGHIITAISRNTGKLPGKPGIIGKSCDIMDKKKLSGILKGHDAVISAYNPGWSDPEIRNKTVLGTVSILESAKSANVKRILLVGGAGSLEIKPGIQLVDTPEFPKDFKEGALGAREALNILKKESVLEWTFISPSVNLVPGERTCKYRLGNDNILFDENGESRISTQDLAVAILDEIENPRFIKKRFTAGY